MPSAAPILLVTRNLPPLQGGIERLMQHAIEELCRTKVCDVLGPSGCRAWIPAARQVWELPPRLPWFHVGAFWRVVRAREYGLCLAGNGLVAPLVRLAAHRASCPYAVFVHGLDLVVDHPLYQNWFLPSIRAADAVVANSRHTAALAAARGVRQDRIHMVHPGVSVPVELADGAAFRERHGFGRRPILLSVGRLVARKGIAEFVERSLPSVLAEIPDASLVVVGEEPRQAAGRSSGARQAIERTAMRTGVTKSITLLGSIGDAELAQAYAASDAFVFPVLDLPGDVEGFGMVALEAAAHGLPTVAFSVGGVADAVSRRSGLLVAPGNFAGFAESVLRVLKREVPELDADSCRRHAADNDWRRFGQLLSNVVDATVANHRR